MTGTRATRRDWIGLGVLTLPTILIALDMNVLHLAAPKLSEDLQPSSSELLWILDIYGFLIAGFLVTMGTLGDRIGRRRILLVGAAAFGAASLLAAYATSAEFLIAARALLGIAGATLMPSTMALIRNMFTDETQRTQALAVWMGGFMAGGAIGPLVGGLLLEYFWWGSVFLLGVPVMALLLALGPILLPEYRDPAAGRLDLLSVGLSLVTVLPVIYGMKEAAKGDFSATTIAAGLVGVGFGVLFVRRQRRLADPLIDLRLFASRGFSVSLGSLMVGVVAMGGIVFLINQYFQLVLGLSPLEAGLWSLPQVAAMLLSTQLAPRVTSRFRPAVVLGASMAIAVAGLVLVMQASLALIVTGFVVMSVGFGPWLLLATSLIIGTAPPERAGAASAISETGQEFGMAFGLAALGSVGVAIYRSGLSESVPPGVPSSALDSARESLGGALATASELPDSVGGPLVDAARRAFTEGLQVTAGISAALIALGAVVTVAMLRGMPRQDGGTDDGTDNTGEPGEARCDDGPCDPDEDRVREPAPAGR